MMFPVLADVVWPALFLSMRLSAWWCIGVSVVIEAVALWRFARMQPVKAAAASVVMNAVSAFCGSLLLPMAGLHWESVATNTYNAWFHWGTFNVGTEAATWLIAVCLSTVIETLVLWLVFFMPWKRRTILVVLAANAITTALALVTIVISAPR
jgi:hypothetical protein